MVEAALTIFQPSSVRPGVFRAHRVEEFVDDG
jgi:hypothetical protein